MLFKVQFTNIKVNIGREEGDNSGSGGENSNSDSEDEYISNDELLEPLLEI
jgi:hypothetical protein